jgi:hypothetical protein
VANQLSQSRQEEILQSLSHKPEQRFKRQYVCLNFECNAILDECVAGTKSNLCKSCGSDEIVEKLVKISEEEYDGYERAKAEQLAS